MDTQRLIIRLFDDWKKDRSQRFSIGLISGATFEGRITEFDSSGAFLRIEMVNKGWVRSTMIHTGAIISASTVVIK